MKKERLIISIALLVLFIISSYFALRTTDKANGITGQTAAVSSSSLNLKSENTKTISEEGAIEVVFCPREDCAGTMEQYVRRAGSSVHCAFYDLRLDNVIDSLNSAAAAGIDIKIIVDNENIEYMNRSEFTFIKDPENTMMHNKFCIIDKESNNPIIMTGSFNPTPNCAFRNNNNLVIIQSKTIADLYDEEFNEMWSGKFSGGKASKRIRAELPNATIEANFCPDDSCEARLINILRNANSSIRFMTFSFTLTSAKELLIEKHRNGIEVEGVFEKKQLSDWDIYDSLLLEGLPVLLDTNKYNMHHKAFIIDGRIIVTGSMNPTNNGVKHNDENMLIIYNKEHDIEGSITKRFLEEFEQVYPD